MPVYGSPLKDGLRYLAHGLFYVICSAEAPEHTTGYAKKLLNQIDPSQELLAVRSFNALGKVLFGSYNTITIPYLNYVIIDDELASLPEQEQRFVLGRSMAIIANRHRYVGTKYVLPYLISLFYEWQIPEHQKNEHNSFTHTLFNAPFTWLRSTFGRHVSRSEHERIQALPTKAGQLIKPIGLATMGLLASRYLSRTTEYNLDRLTTDTFDCTEGAMNYFVRASWQANENNPFLTFILKYHLFPWYAKHHLIPPLQQAVPLVNELQKIRSIQNLTVLRPPRLEHLPQKLIDAAPGQVHHDMISAPHFTVLLIPYAEKLLRDVPDYRDRAETLLTKKNR